MRPLGISLKGLGLIAGSVMMGFSSSFLEHYSMTKLDVLLMDIIVENTLCSSQHKGTFVCLELRLHSLVAKS